MACILLAADVKLFTWATSNLVIAASLTSRQNPLPRQIVAAGLWRGISHLGEENELGSRRDSSTEQLVRAKDVRTVRRAAKLWYDAENVGSVSSVSSKAVDCMWGSRLPTLGIHGYVSCFNSVPDWLSSCHHAWLLFMLAQCIQAQILPNSASDSSLQRSG